MDISRGTIIKSILWRFFEKISVQGVQFIVTIVLARVLSPAEFGIIALISIFIILSNVIVEGGLTTALIQKKDADNIDFSTIFYTNLAVSLSLYIILFLAAPFIASFYDEPQLTSVVRVLSITIFFYAFNAVQMAYVAKHMLFRKMFTVSLISSISAGCLGIALALLNLGVWALVAYNLSMTVFTTLIMWFVIKWRPLLIFDKIRFRGLFNYGVKIFFTNFIITLFVNIRSLIIGKMYSAGTLAVFDRGKQLPCLIMDNITAAIQVVMLPAFSNEQDDRPKVKSMLSRAIKTSSLFIFPLLVVLFVTAKPLVLFLLTDKWIEAVPFVRIFCVAYILLPIQMTNMEVIKSLGKSNIILKMEFVKKTIEITVLIISLCFDVYAIAWGVVVYNFICLYINLYPNSKLIDYKVTEQIKDVLPCFIISIIMGLIISLFLFLDLPNIIMLLIQFVVGVGVYILLCYAFKLDSFFYVLELVKNKISSK